MIDTDKYEGLNELINRIIDSDEIGIDDLLADSMAVKKSINELLAEVKRLRERLMLAESALGEVRACHEDGQGNLGEILEHYRDKEGVEMPNAFDEVIK